MSALHPGSSSSFTRLSGGIGSILENREVVNFYKQINLTNEVDKSEPACSTPVAVKIFADVMEEAWAASISSVEEEMGSMNESIETLYETPMADFNYRGFTRKSPDSVIAAKSQNS